ncbi:MAG: sigma-70 family RNA polymerase sigma factor [Magnetococcales bacterium]|nr:sigma-70 family RNA polymerase sigma factor [Magnetococcales bacterium]
MKRLPGIDPDLADVHAAKAGDSAAFSALLNRLHLRVFRFILRQSASNQDAEDLTQETFLEAYRRLATFQETARFSTWVLGIAQNLVRNYRNRSPQFRYPAISSDSLLTLSDGQNNPEEQLQQQNRINQLRQGIEQHLTPELRQALTLVTLEGMDYQEVAEILEIPLGTVKTRVFRARKALRERLDYTGASQG